MSFKVLSMEIQKNLPGLNEAAKIKNSCVKKQNTYKKFLNLRNVVTGMTSLALIVMAVRVCSGFSTFDVENSCHEKSFPFPYS
jgi:hypothetical protein